jgi:hypothetical protein
MEKASNLSIKQFFAEIKKALKPNYKSAVTALVGLFVISVAIMMGLGVVGYMLLRSLMMKYYMMMYGMSTISSIVIGAVEVLAILIVMIIVLFVVSFFGTAIKFNFQDVVRDPSKKIKIRAIYDQFKRLKKWQLVRLALYIWLFASVLWQLPVDILNGFFGSNQIVAEILKVVGGIIAIWKGLEYSQALWLYREKQPEFLGQSMRHAITASRRFMGGRKINWLILSIAGYVPLIVWTVVWGAIVYFGANYGSFTMPTAVIYILLAIMVIGICAYLPVLLMMGPVYYEANKHHINLDTVYEDTLLPKDQLVDPMPEVQAAPAPEKAAEPAETNDEPAQSAAPTSDDSDSSDSHETK